jgi:hypothetical protein
MNSVTIVSCYYKVKSKHSHSKYNEWISNFLQNLRNNIIIFTSEDLVDYLKEIGKNNNQMMIIIKNFEDIDILKQYNIWDYQYELDPQKNIRTKECYIIWNSKMNFVRCKFIFSFNFLKLFFYAVRKVNLFRLFALS